MAELVIFLLVSAVLIAFGSDSKFNPYGNHEDPLPSVLFMVNRPDWLRVIAWRCRNPLHNFFFHWVGVAGAVVRFEGSFLKPGFNNAWTHTKRFKFPLISYRADRFECYVGWRENGGFGLALRKANSKLDSGVVPR